MTIGLALFSLAIVGLTVGAYWTLYQVTLAAWGSFKAKPHWRAIVASPIGQILLPIYKWLLPATGVIFVTIILFQLLSGAYAI
jgi:hypothetical protein